MNVKVIDERPGDAAAIELLLDFGFGLTRRVKTSYRLREGSMAATGLSLVVPDAEFGVSGAVSFWPLLIGKGETPALLLGPLAVHPARQNQGIGSTLMKEGIARAKDLGHALVILVGDVSYYARVGFARVPARQIELPGPTDPHRLLFLELKTGALSQAKGLALPPWRWREINGLRATT